ncbi:protein arginine kinase [bacterium]|nr:protein arginine kinase [bacterium]
MTLLSDGDFTRCPWLANANGSPFQVVSSRIRLARNLEGHPFSHWAGPRDLSAVAAAVREAVARCSMLSDCEIIPVDKLDEADRLFLAERQLISRELAAGGAERLVIVRRDQRLSLMVNEEDHLRIQCLSPGLALRETWREVNDLDDQLEHYLPYAFHPRWGYLTACPTNTGTGIRCSVMLHLPALVMIKKVNRLLSAVQKLGMTVRGTGGEGTEITGNLFQISNQQTLGVSEVQEVEQLEELVKRLIDWEEEALGQLQKEARSLIEDKIWRAYGILQHARTISSLESNELLSALRLGVRLGIVTNVSVEALNQVMICSGPGHLQKIAGTHLEPAQRDAMRAEFIRERIPLN